MPKKQTQKNEEAVVETKAAAKKVAKPAAEAPVVETPVAEVEAKVEGKLAEAKAKVEETKAKVEARVEETKAKVEARVEETKAKVEETKAKVEARVEEAKAKVEARVEESKETAKDVFLATLGVYGKAYDDSSAKIKELNAKREEQFKDYVSRGTEVEASVKNKIEALRSEDSKINARVNSLRESYDKLTSAFSKKKSED